MIAWRAEFLVAAAAIFAKHGFATPHPVCSSEAMLVCRVKTAVSSG